MNNANYEYPRILMSISPPSGRMPGGARGEQALQIPVDLIPFIGQMHPEVEIVRVLPAPDGPYNGWIVDRRPPPYKPEFLYLHIRSRYAFRHGDGGPLCTEDFLAFLERYHNLWKEGR